MIRTEERDYERIEPNIRGIGYKEGERGKTHDGAGRRQARRKQAVRQQAKKVIRREGGLAFRHGNEGKERPWKTKPATEARIIALYRGKYAGFNFRHFLEKLSEEEGIAISYEPLRRILTSAGFKSPKGHRSKKEKAKHPSRPRRKCFGELLQIDASIHNWFGDSLPKATLHGAIDDATGSVMGL